MNKHDPSFIVAFFYMTNTPKGSNGTYYQRIEEMKARLKPFVAHYINYNNPKSL